MSKQKSLEHDFLQSLSDKKIQVSIFLKSGIKLHGVIEKVEGDVIFLKDAITQMVYKHAVSTVVPVQSPF
jgi:host factor-I protein